MDEKKKAPPHIKIPKEGFYESALGYPDFIAIAFYLYERCYDWKGVDMGYGDVSIEQIKNMIGYGRNSEQTQRIRDALAYMLECKFLSLGSPDENANTSIDINNVRPMQTIHYCFHKSEMNELKPREFTLVEDKTIKKLLTLKRNFAMPTTNRSDMINIYFFVRSVIYKTCYKYPINKLKRELGLGGNKIYDCLRVLEENELLYQKLFYNSRAKHDDSYFRLDPFPEKFVPDEIKEAKRCFYRKRIQ